MAPKKQPAKKQPPIKKEGLGTKKLCFTDENLIEVLRENGGLVKFAARRFGCTDRTIYNRIKDNPEIKIAIKEARNRFIDEAENVLQKAVQKGSLPAVFFTLKTIGRHRGYVERRETRVGGDNNAPPVTTTNLITINPDELPLDVRKALLEYVRSKKTQNQTPENKEQRNGQV